MCGFPFALSLSLPLHVNLTIFLRFPLLQLEYFLESCVCLTLLYQNRWIIVYFWMQCVTCLCFIHLNVHVYMETNHYIVCEQALNRWIMLSFSCNWPADWVLLLTISNALLWQEDPLGERTDFCPIKCFCVSPTIDFLTSTLFTIVFIF